jgi:hypothetical protein
MSLSPFWCWKGEDKSKNEEGIPVQNEKALFPFCHMVV